MDLLQTYQNEGITALEKRMDETLESPVYWMHYLADKNVTYGLYSNFTELLFCNKKEAKLKRLSISTDHTIDLKNQVNTLTGEKNGDKVYEGDLRTPVGVYLLKDRIDNPNPFYGPLALVTDYPNSYDKSLDKSGSGIWIHGYPLKGERNPYTKGCLALSNDDLSSLNKLIKYKETALIIAPDTFPTTKKETIASILASLFQWRNHWKASDLKPYLSFYDKHFKRPNGLSLTQFSIIKQGIFSHKIKRHIDLNHISVIPYPTEDNRTLFYLSFIENYKAGKVNFHGLKKLYIEYKNDKISILTEN